MDYLVPVERGQEWNKERCLSLPPGIRYTIVEYDKGEYAEAVSGGVKQSPSDTVYIGAPDAWVDRDPNTLQFLEDQMWNGDVTYGPLVHWADGKPAYVQGQEHFCPNRLYRENYLPGVACVRRDSFLKAGGLRTGMWDTYVRMHEAGAHIKYVGEAPSARDDQQPDPSPVPTPKELKATFYYQATAGTTYWRCLLPARYLPGQAIFNHPVKVVGENNELTLPQQEGACVMQFTGDESHYLLAKYLKEKGVRVLVEVDDNYSHWFPEQMKRNGWKRDVEATMQDVPHPTDPSKTVRIPFGYNVETHLETVKIADGVICTTPFLAAQYRKHNANVFVCGNHIDPADWPDVEKPDDGVFRIGWFASASHRADGSLIDRALRWAHTQPDVEIVMVGIGGTPSGRPMFPYFAYKWIPWSPDFAVYRKNIQEFDVGLSPVVGTPWAQYRSDLKALEYAMGATLPIVSDQPPYRDLQMPHVTRCKTPKDWLRAVQWAVANRDEVREQGREVREWTLEHRTIQKNVGEWELAVAA